MLAKQYRLQKDRDFKLVFENGKTVNSKFLFFKFKKNDLPISRFGFIIGKKISKKSTIRNTIKRKLREIIRKKINNIKPGFDIMIGAKTEILGKTYQELEQEVDCLINKL